jgi:hypothetical protein
VLYSPLAVADLMKQGLGKKGENLLFPQMLNIK